MKNSPEKLQKIKEAIQILNDEGTCCKCKDYAIIGLIYKTKENGVETISIKQALESVKKVQERHNEEDQSCPRFN